MTVTARDEPPADRVGTWIVDTSMLDVVAVEPPRLVESLPSSG